MIDCMLCFNLFCLFSYLFMSVCCVTLCCIVLYCNVVIIKVVNKTSSLLWPPHGIGQAIIFSSRGFFFFFLLFSSPILSHRALVAKIQPDKFV